MLHSVGDVVRVSFVRSQYSGIVGVVSDIVWDSIWCDYLYEIIYHDTGCIPHRIDMAYDEIEGVTYESGHSSSAKLPVLHTGS